MKADATPAAVDGLNNLTSRSSTTATSSSSSSFRHRKLDAVYLIFFVYHFAVVTLIDLVNIYPRSLVPSILLRLNEFYEVQFKDQLFLGTTSPTWFTMYKWMEALYHLPLCIYAVRGLWTGDSATLPLHLLLFASQMGLTTITCLADMLAWPVPTSQKIAVAQLYAPYLIFAVFMGSDMFFRLKRDLMMTRSGTRISGNTKKSKKRN